MRPHAHHKLTHMSFSFASACLPQGTVALMGAKVQEIDEAYRAKEGELKGLRARLEKLRGSQGLMDQREKLELAVVWAAVKEIEEVRRWGSGCWGVGAMASGD